MEMSDVIFEAFAEHLLAVAKLEVFAVVEENDRRRFAPIRDTIRRAAKEPSYADLQRIRAAVPSYGDVLKRPVDDPTRDLIRATPDWTPVKLPGTDLWRHWTPNGQVDTTSYEFALEAAA